MQRQEVNYVGSDPLRTVWRALEAKGYEPHGQPHDYRSACPAHGGENPDALHVSVGADGRALLHCHAHPCRAERIVDAIGLEMRDLFPPGHRRGRRFDLRVARRADFTGPAREVVNVLAALDELAVRWTAMVVMQCVYCGGQAWLRASSTSRPYLDCTGGCGLTEFKGSLAVRVEERRAA